ncbi:3'-5' exonuclease [Actinopolymorpha pittospori]|uniref:DNA polymerase III epsilon subunit-like protein n=1 Tax=Actinopolymorpha pittospori TaxID=648752 RepID=A0A927RCU8_9ACTN|nr:3'-5' exonuclease [Actinopolymorpha pittospori]MBE1610294.1 DNA polymerase III epsilon subunit-like protein [Actinopolymorpha pittospori]
MGEKWSDLRYVAVDVEGNGQRPPDLVEVAVVPIDEGTIGPATSWLVHPPRPITPMARRFHRISDSDVATAPTIAQLAEQIRGFLDGAVFSAHNAPIDLGVLTRELPGFEPTHVVDTLKLARQALPGRQSYKLGDLAEDFGLAEGLPDGLAPHRATWDALVCARLLVRLAEHIDTESFEPQADSEPEVLF